MSTQSMNTYLLIGGRLHGEERLLDVDQLGNPPATFIDILSGATYYPRAVGYALPDPVTGQPTEAMEAVFYFLEGVNEQNQAMSMLADVMLRRYMHEHGRKVKVETTQKLVPNETRPSGLVIP